MRTLRRAAPPPPATDELGRRRVHAIVDATQDDALAAFALRRDKAHVFSPDGTAAVGYQVRFGTAVASGDPVGRPESRPAAVAALWSSGHVSVGDLWKVYAAHPYMPRLRDQSVLTNGLTDQPLLWQQDGFALAQSYDSGPSRYVGLVLPSDESSIAINDSVLIVKPEPAEAQRATERSAVSVDDQPPHPDDAPSDEPVGPPMPETPAKTRFFGVKTLSADKYGSEFKKLSDEILVHLVGGPNVRVKLRIEIEAENMAGFDESKIRTVSENATQLKFDDASFEDE